ncbi:MAG: hypothetical protein MZU97_08495 [Bacillus subtilis]|nr:hypothetical protein [Bacillus subtilis]
MNQANLQTRCDIDFASEVDLAGVFDNADAYSLFFVEADASSTQGIAIAKTILQHSPLANVILFMPECRFEYSMMAMRIGVKNILINEEINVNAIVEILQPFPVSTEIMRASARTTSNGPLSV